jgi:hypothetical protein
MTLRGQPRQIWCCYRKISIPEVAKAKVPCGVETQRNASFGEFARCRGDALKGSFKISGVQELLKIDVISHLAAQYSL